MKPTMDYSTYWAEKNIRQPDTIAKQIKRLKQPVVTFKRNGMVKTKYYRSGKFALTANSTTRKLTHQLELLGGG